MSENILYILYALLVMLFWFFIISFFVKQKRKINETKLFIQYQQQNPHFVTKKGTRCANCGRSSIQNEYFIFNCNHCGKKLYKVKR
jgi:hypothetical protein